MAPDEKPLAESASDEEEEEDSDSTSPDDEESAEAAPRPPVPTFKLSTFLYTFLFLLGILMVFDSSTRNLVASGLDRVLAPTIGFGGQFLLLTMFLAAAIEMIATALAYNWATDWVKAAKVQKWSAAFRKVQMAAIRSRKKDRIAALQPHQSKLTRLSGEVSIAQLKGMAVTWFLVIAVYAWVGIFLLHNQPAIVNLGGAQVSLAGPAQAKIGGFLPDWFLLFTLYTVPMSLVFRRVLKHYSLRKYEASLPLAPPVPGSGTGGPA